ncbi:MAG: glutaredoxin family protein [Chloroflexi bacterium]|nr:glutaredoxin family protein [Chloroflexota bacterium]
MARRLVVYTRTTQCPYWDRSKLFLDANKVPYHMLNIEMDPAAAQRLQHWLGSLTVPTMVIAEENSLEPFYPPAPLADDQSAHGVDRGTMFSEPSDRRLEIFLRRHGIMK